MKKFVRQLVEEYQTDCPFKLASELGITVCYEPLGSIHGYFKMSKRMPIVKINEDLSYNQQRFALSHEIAHFLFHKDHNTSFMKMKTFFSTEKIEIEAHTFALELIFINHKYVTKQELDSYGIPHELLRYKSHSK
jgi:Zn-dependent peptidase ImmA (M78 family)